MKTLFTILLWLVFRLAIAETNSSLTDEQLLGIKFDQKLNAQISPALSFRDETGKPIQFGDCFSNRPVVLMLGYYGCPMLCTLVLNGATETFRDLKWTIGEDFNVVFVSIDPAETAALAAEKKRNYVRSYHRGDANGWRFLTGDPAAIQSLADEVGFRFAYDPVAKQFAHPSGFVVLTPTGKVARYFFGVTFSPAEVDAALRAAAVEKVDPPASPLALLCFHYAPIAGKFGRLVMLIVRIGGVVTVLVLGALFLLPSSQRKPGPPP